MSDGDGPSGALINLQDLESFLIRILEEYGNGILGPLRSTVILIHQYCNSNVRLGESSLKFTAKASTPMALASTMSRLACSSVIPASYRRLVIDQILSSSLAM